jgi:hypothetical protein
MRINEISRQIVDGAVPDVAYRIDMQPSEVLRVSAVLCASASDKELVVVLEDLLFTFVLPNPRCPVWREDSRSTQTAPAERGSSRYLACQGSLR